MAHDRDLFVYGRRGQRGQSQVGAYSSTANVYGNNVIARVQNVQSIVSVRCARRIYHESILLYSINSVTICFEADYLHKIRVS